MTTGPLAVRWHDWTLGVVRAGAVSIAHVELENAGTVAWSDEILLGYHWLDDRGNPLVWDGQRTYLPRLAPGERSAVQARVRGPIPPGRYGFAFDLVAEHRAWFSELGGEELRASVDVAPRDEAAHADLPHWVEPADGWRQRVDSTHAEGYAAVAGAIAWHGGIWHPPPRAGRRAGAGSPPPPRPPALAPSAPGSGRNPGFPSALVCPSIVEGLQLA